ncbi:hypothetical protein EV175_001004, partial [Coemansia sp. RSA 1933]
MPLPNDDTSEKAQSQPTWSQIESTRTKVLEQPVTNTKQSYVLCYRDSKAKFPAGSLMSKSAGNQKGQAYCLEIMTRKMAMLQLEKRIAAKNTWLHSKKWTKASDNWANRFGLRWILQMRFLTVLGNSHIDYLDKQSKRTHILSDVLIDQAVQKSGMLKKSIFTATPLDDILGGVLDGSENRFISGVKDYLGPGIRGYRKYVDSWKNGSQKEWLH